MSGASETKRGRARESGGSSDGAILSLVAHVVRESGAPRGTLVDVGCGSGALAAALAGTFERYIGLDAVAYEGFPNGSRSSFVEADLDRAPYPLAEGTADVVAAVETIEHLENPRGFVRELARIARPGALVLVTTPNLLSWLSKLTLVVRGEWNAFQEKPGLYPAHITPLLEVDLIRIARECELEDARVLYTDSGRVPGMSWRWPARLGFRGRRFSDNVLLAARRRPA